VRPDVGGGERVGKEAGERYKRVFRVVRRRQSQREHLPVAAFERELHPSIFIGVRHAEHAHTPGTTVYRQALAVERIEKIIRRNSGRRHIATCLLSKKIAIVTFNNSSVFRSGSTECTPSARTKRCAIEGFDRNQPHAAQRLTMINLVRLAENSLTAINLFPDTHNSP
jgi:hypothetical protein